MCDPSQYLPLAVEAEQHGYDTVVVPDSICYPEVSDSKYPYTDDGNREFLAGKPFIEPFSLIPAMGAVTEKLRFTTFVVKLPIRQPVLVAKQATSVAVLTNDRFGFGVGLSPWPEDFAATGFSYEVLCGAVLNTLRGLLNQPELMLQLELPYPSPGHRALYREVFGEAVAFDRPRARLESFLNFRVGDFFVSSWRACSRALSSKCAGCRTTSSRCSTISTPSGRAASTKAGQFWAKRGAVTIHPGRASQLTSGGTDSSPKLCANFSMSKSPRRSAKKSSWKRTKPASATAR